MSRISIDEARELWLNADDEELRSLAQAARARFHEPDRATYMVMRIIIDLHERLRRPVRLLRVLRPPQPGGRLRALA